MVFQYRYQLKGTFVLNLARDYFKSQLAKLFFAILSCFGHLQCAEKMDKSAERVTWFRVLPGLEWLFYV